MSIGYAEVILRLTLAVVLGGMIGFEREAHNRPAGFRTHILVCVGSALIMIVSAYGFSGFIELGFEVDPGRMAAQVITGIGFLGAGTIIMNRGTIQGLTTAAAIWVVSGIGLAAGLGLYLPAAFTAVIVLVCLILLNRVDRTFFSQKRLRRMYLKALDRPGLLGKIGEVLGELNISIRKISLETSGFDEKSEEETVSISMLVKVPASFNNQELFKRLKAIKIILELSWQGEDVMVFIRE